jgi:hypothetical protein
MHLLPLWHQQQLAQEMVLCLPAQQLWAQQLAQA